MLWFLNHSLNWIHLSPKELEFQHESPGGKQCPHIYKAGSRSVHFSVWLGVLPYGWDTQADALALRHQCS